MSEPVKQVDTSLVLIVSAARERVTKKLDASREKERIRILEIYSPESPVVQLNQKNINVR